MTTTAKQGTTTAPRRTVSRALAVRILQTCEARFDSLIVDELTATKGKRTNEPRYDLEAVMSLAARLGSTRRECMHG